MIVQENQEFPVEFIIVFVPSFFLGYITEATYSRPNLDKYSPTFKSLLARTLVATVTVYLLTQLAIYIKPVENPDYLCTGILISFAAGMIVRGMSVNSRLNNLENNSLMRNMNNIDL